MFWDGQGNRFCVSKLPGSVIEGEVDSLLLVKNVPSFCDQLNPERTELAFVCRDHHVSIQYSTLTVMSREKGGEVKKD